MGNNTKKIIKNYANELIPDHSILFERYQRRISNLSVLPKYSFDQLFVSKKIKGRIGCYRIQLIWEPLFNNWRVRDYEEIKKSEAEQKPKNEVKGVYIFYENDIPVYVGMSRKISIRLRNHFQGTSHFQATLVYLILRCKHDNLHGRYHGERAKLSAFKNEREELQKVMRRQWKISIIPIKDNYEMYMTEILLACKLKTKWNSFETH